MRSSKFRLQLLSYILLSNLIISAQSLQHPTIWVTRQEKPLILENVAKYDWAKSIVAQLHDHVDKAKNNHQSHPEAILNAIPAFGGNMTRHNEILTLGAESGMLYFLTDDESYAQFSADIMAAYMALLAPETPKTTEIMGEEFFDGRTTYPLLALIYDFVYDFIKDPGTTIYDSITKTRTAFNNGMAQKAIRNIAGNILQEYSGPDVHGRVVTNHPILTAPGALYPILCVEDDTERERLFNIFWETGTDHQPSFKHTLLNMFSSQGIWPESVSYSFMTNIPMVLNIVDRIKPELNVAGESMSIFEGSFLFPNLTNPDGTYIRYGDSKRLKSGSAEYYRFIMHIADRRGYADLKRQAEIVLKQEYNDKGGYKPTLTNPVYDYNAPLELFWGINIPDSVKGNIDYKPTVIIKHAGVALQRNYVAENNELYGLTGYIGGAHYVHSHCTGIAMELYGAGYVMAPNGGLPPTTRERGIPLHSDYFRLYAGNNTVIVNGTSHGIQKGAWKSESNVWQNTTVNIASEPLHMQDPISENFSFATQFLKDEVNNCDQERTLSIIRTSPTTGYYFDMFRSVSLDENKFHDYIYHNIGDETSIYNAKNEKLPLHSTERYNNDIGDIVHSPGWRFFEQEQVTAPTREAVKIRFDVKYDDRFMHLFVPGGIPREYTKALGPPTREARHGYLNKMTQILAIRQQGEAWNKPFLALFEPSLKSVASIQSVKQLVDGDKVVGAEVFSVVDNCQITDYIIAQDKDDATYHNAEIDLDFTGRFAIVRKEVTDKKTAISLYIGDGKRLRYKNHEATGDEQNRALHSFKP